MLCYVVSYHTTDHGRSYLSSSQLTHIPNMFQPALVAMLRYQHSISVGFTSIVDFHFEAKTVQYYLPWIPQPYITTEFIIMTKFCLKTMICICQMPFLMPNQWSVEWWKTCFHITISRCTLGYMTWTLWHTRSSTWHIWAKRVWLRHIPHKLQLPGSSWLQLMSCSSGKWDSKKKSWVKQ